MSWDIYIPGSRADEEVRFVAGAMDGELPYLWISHPRASSCCLDWRQLKNIAHLVEKYEATLGRKKPRARRGSPPTAGARHD